ncbi:hypothetical protein G7046_g10064 [Stylonectria norvegica]|nr:hypothetical protein G7046_g10064 [Stylonectria norvegica]
MANLLPEEVEILVHVAAPSRAADDVAYRQLAQAYLDFQPQARTKLSPAADLPGERRSERNQAYEQAPSHEFATSEPEPVFDLNSQDLSFQSALDNRSSPRLRLGKYNAAHDVIAPSSQEDSVGSQVSWCAPASQISDSYPMPPAGLMHVSPTRVLQRYLGAASSWGNSTTPSSPSARKRQYSPSTNSGRVDVPSSLPAQGDESAQAPEHMSATKIIPATPKPSKQTGAPASLTDNDVAPGQVVDLTSDDIGPDITHISSSDWKPSSPRGVSEPPTKRPKVTQLQHGDLVRSSSDTGPAPSMSNPALEKINNSLEIRPPSPPVGVADIEPSDLISEKLAKLARDLSSRYRPESKRPVDPFERGYWLLDCRTWSLEVRFDTWVFLNNYLRSGLAGWGTWCRRDKPHDWIRLYCWGHVTKHTYLLLYLASGRQLKMTGAGWYGADGEVVLEVPPFEKQV